MLAREADQMTFQGTLKPNTKVGIYKAFMVEVRVVAKLSSEE